MRLLFKVFFTSKYIKIIFYYFLKIICDISVSKWSENTKNISTWSKEKIKKIYNFFQNHFWNVKTNSILRNLVKKAYRNCRITTAFQTQIFSGSRITNYSLVCYQTPNHVCFTANIKTDEKQMQPKYCLEAHIVRI